MVVFVVVALIVGLVEEREVWSEKNLLRAGTSAKLPCRVFASTTLAVNVPMAWRVNVSSDRLRMDNACLGGTLIRAMCGFSFL